MGSGASSPAGTNNSHPPTSTTASRNRSQTPSRVRRGRSMGSGLSQSSSSALGSSASTGIGGGAGAPVTRPSRPTGSSTRGINGSTTTAAAPPAGPVGGSTGGGGAGGSSGGAVGPSHLILNQPYPIGDRQGTALTNAGDEVDGNRRPNVPAINRRASGNELVGYDGDQSDAASASVASTYVPTLPPSATMSFDLRGGEPAPPVGGVLDLYSHSVTEPLPPPPPVPGSEITPTRSRNSSNGGTFPYENNPVTIPPSPPVHCLNPASEINARLDTQVEVRVYPCNNSAAGSGGKKKLVNQFTVKPEGVIIQGTNKHRSTMHNDLGAEYALHVGRKLQRYELSDTRACQLLVTTHSKSFWVVPAPEAFSRHSGTCRLLGDRKHPLAPHTLQVGDFLRVGSVGVVVIETHNGVENRVLSEEKIQKIMKDTTNSNGGFLDLGETDGENSDDSMIDGEGGGSVGARGTGDYPVCYMCFDDSDEDSNPLITPCKCLGDTKYVHVNCLRKWHTAEADNQICFLSSVDATCSVCKSTFKSDFKLKDGRLVKLFKSSLEPPYVSLLVATKHEMAQRLFNTRFQLSFSTLLKPDGRNGTRPLLLGRSSGSDMVLDYRTVSARHASIRLKNGEFIFTDAGSSNGSYLYLRRPVELTPSQSVQFRLGRSMISMKVVNKWNRRLLRAVRRTGHSSSSANSSAGDGDDHSVGSNEDDVRVTDGRTGNVARTVPRRTRDSIMKSLPPPGTLSQASHQHLDLLHALAYPKHAQEKDVTPKKKDPPKRTTSGSSVPSAVVPTDQEESKEEEPEISDSDPLVPSYDAALVRNENGAEPVGDLDVPDSSVTSPLSTEDQPKESDGVGEINSSDGGPDSERNNDLTAVSPAGDP